MQTITVKSFRNSAIASALVLLLAVPAAFACTVPVARYALERWPPDLHILHVRPGVGQQLGMLGNGHANAWVAAADASQTNDLRVTFPQTDIAWYEGPWRPGMPDALSDSPMRRRIAHELVTGAMAVCLFFDGTEAATNAALFAQVESQLARLQGSLTLPADPSYDPVTPSSPPPQLRSQIPLKVSFTLHRLARNAPGEEFLTRQIDTMLPDSARPVEPKLVFVFGRGRAIAMPPGTPLDTSIDEFTQFLCGACSCQVKEMNPGLDLLMTANWEEAVGNYPAAAESILVSGGSFRFGGELRGQEPVQPVPATAPAQPSTPGKPAVNEPATPPHPSTGTTAKPATASPDTTLWVLVALTALVLLALAALFLRGIRRG